MLEFLVDTLHWKLNWNPVLCSLGYGFSGIEVGLTSKQGIPHIILVLVFKE